MFTNVHADTHNTHTHLHTTHTHTQCSHIHVHTRARNIHMHTHIYIYTHMHTYTHTTLTHEHTCTQHTHTHNAHTYIHTCTRTHTHTHTHTPQCDPSEATWQLIRSVLNGTNETTGETIVNPFKIMFLGGGCSLATEPLAALSGRFYNVTQVCEKRRSAVRVTCI